jgi:hypothetical protein
MSAIGNARRAIVQTASTWPQSDIGWESQQYWTPLTATASVAGTGSASIVAKSGKVFDPITGRLEFLRLGESPVGKWCRIIVQDDAGTIDVAGVKYSAKWHGVIKQRSIKPSGAGLPNVSISISAAYVTAAYEACDILHSFELDNEDNLTESYLLPVFNLYDGGDMSANDDAIIDGTFTYVFERSRDATYAQRWTYAAAMRYLCATARPWVPPSDQTTGKVGPILVLGDYPTQLDNALLPMKSGRGRNVVEWMRSIINPSMGCALSFRVDSIANSIYVDIKPCAQSDMPLFDETMATTTIPNPYTGAGATPQTISILEDGTTPSVEITESDDAEDYILAVGGPDIYGITLKIGEALIPSGWDWADEIGDPVEDPFNDACRLFEIDKAWTGEQYDTPGDGLRAAIVYSQTGIDPPPEFGLIHPANGNLQITRHLPYGPSEDLRSGSTPRLFFGPPSGGTKWADMTGKIPIIPLPNGQIRLGQTVEHAGLIKDAYDADEEIILSIGVESWHPLLAAWRRNEATPRDLPRVRRLDLPQCSPETSLEATAIGIDQETGELVKTTSEDSWSESVPGFRNALASEQAKSNVNSTTVSIRTVGSLALRFNLGAPILAVEYGKGSNAETVEVKSIVTSITYDFSAESFGVRYEAYRILDG